MALARATVVAILATLTAAPVAGCRANRTTTHGGALVGAQAGDAARMAAGPVATEARVDGPAGGGANEGGGRRRRFGEVSVYVDGRIVGVLRHSELPPRVHGRVLNFAGYDTTRYPFSEYAAALGVDAARVRGLHLYGGSRASVVDGAEFRRIARKLTFSFVQGDRGKPRIHWPAEHVKVNTTIDMLSAVHFYVDKTPPHPGQDGLVMPDGKPVGDDVPYAPAEQGSGTRVYVDGKLSAIVKRKKLTNDLAVPAEGDGPTQFSLLAYATSVGVDAQHAKTVDFVAGDDVVARVPVAAAQGLSFHVPARNQGHILIGLPSASSASEATGAPAAHVAKVSSVHFFVKATPPDRDVVAIDQAPEAIPAENEARGRGQQEDL